LKKDEELIEQELSEVKERNRELRTQINILQNRVSTTYHLCSTTCVAHIILPNSDRGVGDEAERSTAEEETS